MRPFCPDGHVPAQEIIVWAALRWFPQQTAALETAAAGESAGPADDVNALTPVQKLARAFGGQSSISEGLRQQAVDLLSQAEHRLRNFLHQGALILAAYFIKAGMPFDASSAPQRTPTES
jgi:hypothetical protein